MKKIAILQSNYLPWKGVFDLINQVDIFVFLEDVQYTKRDWRNRNIILTNKGKQWITVPVLNKNKYNQLIYEAEINNEINWEKKHFKAFQFNYKKAPYYKKYEWILEDLYLDKKWNKISELNIYSTKLIANVLGINSTQFINSRNLDIKGNKEGERIINICKKVGAEYFINGPAAKTFMNESLFIENNIKLDYIKYKYPRYKQIYEPFNHFVTVLDLIFNYGPNAPYYIWGWKEDNRGEIEYDTL